MKKGLHQTPNLKRISLPLVSQLLARSVIGSTTGFEPVSLGSYPSEPALIFLDRLCVTIIVT